jgi:hypothetical protein
MLVNGEHRDGIEEAIVEWKGRVRAKILTGDLDLPMVAVEAGRHLIDPELLRKPSTDQKERVGTATYVEEPSIAQLGRNQLIGPPSALSGEESLQEPRAPGHAFA